MEKYSKKELREFGFLLGIFIPLIFGFFLPSIFNHEYRVWTLFVWLFFLLMGFLKPKELKVFYYIWLQIGFCLGWVNSRIIFTVIFFFLLFPISLFMKLSGYDPLKTKKKSLDSYKENNNKDIVDLTRIF